MLCDRGVADLWRLDTLGEMLMCWREGGVLSNGVSCQLLLNPVDIPPVPPVGGG